MDESIEVPEHPGFRLVKRGLVYDLHYSGDMPMNWDEAYAISIEKQESMLWAKANLPLQVGSCGNYSTCGLCLYTFFTGRNHYCNGCPIYEYTGRDSCSGTPWESKDWARELEFIMALRDGREYDLSDFEPTESEWPFDEDDDEDDDY